MSSDSLVPIRLALRQVELPHKTNDVKRVRQKLQRRGLATVVDGHWLTSEVALLEIFPELSEKRRKEKFARADARSRRLAVAQLSSALSSIVELQRENANLLLKLNALANRVDHLEAASITPSRTEQ